ncbi:NAD(P)-dependent oxidoreductase [Phenylobacterium sp. LjRoot219]|uniref:NAD-dependent epimerase/dehydratase family protein n=1 Tax=Phenylobacterium sp. LjRoot219 TaxID=3342283 RepID=UPI003ECFAEB2
MGAVVLLTGASSFTGMWIAEALAQAGFAVVAPLLRDRGDYDPERAARITRVEQVAEVVFGVPFGSPAFLDLVRGRKDIAALAHHAADVTGYRDPGFDATAAFDRNLAGAPQALELLAAQGCAVALVTGTVFEAGEGGDPAEPLAVTPYGLSKTLTNVALQHHASWAGLRFGRFVIPSPYGPFEQQRSFPAYLFRSWFAGETPAVRTPLYLRDHLPAPRLARAYAEHLARLLADPATPGVCRPSGWIATQGAFAEKVAAEAARRLGRPCPVAFAEQTEFPEPLRRVNRDPAPDWDEAAFWDAYVGWYQARR